MLVGQFFFLYVRRMMMFVGLGWIARFRSLWVNRKRSAMDVVDMISDGMEKKPKVIMVSSSMLEGGNCFVSARRYGCKPLRFIRCSSTLLSAVVCLLTFCPTWWMWL